MSACERCDARESWAGHHCHACGARTDAAVVAHERDCVLRHEDAAGSERMSWWRECDTLRDERDRLAAIVRRLAACDPVFTTDGPSGEQTGCAVCAGDDNYDGTVTHEATCPWAQARAWVAAQGSEGT